MKPRVLFFFPTFCDQERISSLTQEVQELLSRHTGEYEILIVDDGSPDQTFRIADELSQISSNVRVIHHPRQQGYGAALRTGLGAGEGFDYVCFTDGDYPIELKYVPEILSGLSEWDGIITRRTNKPYGAYRRVVSEVYNFLVRRLFRLPFKDINSPLKAFRCESISRIDLQSNSPFAPAELLVKALQKGLRISEVAVSSRPQRVGPSHAVRPFNILLTIRDMLRLWWKMKPISKAARWDGWDAGKG